MTPLAIDLYAGLGGWTEGLLSVGYRVVGFDIERHVYGEHRYPAQLVLQDVLTIHGSQFKHADLIVASPPCQAYSYRAMPWKKAKALPPPDNSLFEACFRIQREACEASGRHIPLVVENVRGAQKWVGRSKYHFGSFHLWGDVPALMPIRKLGGFLVGEGVKAGDRNKARASGGHQWTTGFDEHVNEGVKVAGLNWSDRTRKGQAFNTTAQARLREGLKNGGDWFGSGPDCSAQRRCSSREGVKQRGSGAAWFDHGLCKHGSKSNSRKAASAQIAKIPRVLAEHIGRAWWPTSEQHENSATG